METIKELAFSLITKDTEERDSRLKTILNKYDIIYYEESRDNATNIIVELGDRSDDTKVVTLGAHYDVYAGSLGINDNTLSVAVLIKFILAFIEAKATTPIDVVFFDKEETGMLGSGHYAETHKNDIEYAIILDVIGYGDDLVIVSTFEKIAKALEHDLEITHIDGQLASDHMMFSHNRIPSVLIIAAEFTREDFSHTADISRNFYETFHGRRLDNDASILNYDLPNKLLNKLLVMYT